MVSKVQKLVDTLSAFQLNQEMDRDDLIDLVYFQNAHRDRYIRRAFDVHIFHAKKLVTHTFEGRVNIKRVS